MPKNIFSMENKNVIFTGGCGLLGSAMVKALLENGATVYVPSRTDRFDSSYDEYKEAGKLIFATADLSSTEGIKKAFAQAIDTLKRVDVLVNCAVYGKTSSDGSCEYRLDLVPDEVWEGFIDGVIHSVFRCTREILPHFKANGGGNIVNIGSEYGIVAPDFDVYGDNIPWNHPAYSTGKAGIIQYTRYCASALARHNIRVNCLTPGMFPRITPNTDMEFIGRLSNKVMMKRTGKPEDLDGAILLLCSDASSYMTATNIVVDGGMSQW